MSKRDERGGAAKASLNRATIEIAVDPKQGELPMSRLKLLERVMEGRTVEPFKTLGRLVGWSEKLIEPCNSWFSLKQLLGWRRAF